MTAAAILRGWWKAIAGFLLAVLGLLALRRRTPPAPPPGPREPGPAAGQRHDDRVEEADDRLVDELLKPGDQRYEDAAAYLRNRKKAKP
mgnify:CR=1 FL=1